MAQAVFNLLKPTLKIDLFIKINYAINDNKLTGVNASSNYFTTLREY